MTPINLEFSHADDGAFAFDTGVLKGTLRNEGKSIGLVPTVHSETGVEIAGGEGLFNHYRVFVRGKRFGYGARRWPSKAELNDDGSVEVFWEALPDRPFELSGHYIWVAPDTIDLVTTVRAIAPLEAFEVFLASYYQPPFTDTRVWATRVSGEAEFVAATEDHGVWQAFPRDAESARIIKDGRWDLEPHPLDWSIKPTYALPLAIRRDPASALTVVSVAQPDSCFGVFTPYGEEAHYSNYFSFFGHDIAPGDSVSSRSRIIVLNNPSDAEVLARANEFLNAAI